MQKQQAFTFSLLATELFITQTSENDISIFNFYQIWAVKINSLVSLTHNVMISLKIMRKYTSQFDSCCSQSSCINRILVSFRRDYASATDSGSLTVGAAVSDCSSQSWSLPLTSFLSSESKRIQKDNKVWTNASPRYSTYFRSKLSKFYH